MFKPVPTSHETPIKHHYATHSFDTALPPEICHHIIGYVVDLRTLHSLTLTSRMVGQAAEAALYATSFDEHDLNLHKGFLGTIIDSPRHAALVRRYFLLVEDTMDGELYGLLALGLKAMKNLKKLAIYGNQEQSSPAVFLKHCDFQLTHLEWGRTDDEDILAPFLNNQRLLRYLSIRWSAFPLVHLPSSALPNLVQVEGGLGALQTFLPLGRVTQVRYNPYMDNSLSNEIVLESVRNIRMLAIGSSYGAFLSHIVGDLHNVETLELAIGSVTVRLPPSVTGCLSHQVGTSFTGG